MDHLDPSQHGAVANRDVRAQAATLLPLLLDYIVDIVMDVNLCKNTEYKSLLLR